MAGGGGGSGGAEESMRLVEEKRGGYQNATSQFPHTISRITDAATLSPTLNSSALLPHLLPYPLHINTSSHPAPVSSIIVI